MVVPAQCGGVMVVRGRSNGGSLTMLRCFFYVFLSLTVGSFFSLVLDPFYLILPSFYSYFLCLSLLKLSGLK